MLLCWCVGGMRCISKVGANNAFVGWQDTIVRLIFLLTTCRGSWDRWESRHQDRSAESWQAVWQRLVLVAQDRSSSWRRWCAQSQSCARPLPDQHSATVGRQLYRQGYCGRYWERTSLDCWVRRWSLNVKSTDQTWTLKMMKLPLLRMGHSRHNCCANCSWTLWNYLQKNFLHTNHLHRNLDFLVMMIYKQKLALLLNH